MLSHAAYAAWQAAATHAFDEALVAFGTPEFAALAAGAGGCVAFGGLMSGLSLGLLSQDATDLEVVARTGSAASAASAGTKASRASFVTDTRMRCRPRRA